MRFHIQGYAPWRPQCPVTEAALASVSYGSVLVRVRSGRLAVQVGRDNSSAPTKPGAQGGSLLIGGASRLCKPSPITTVQYQGSLFLLEEPKGRVEELGISRVGPLRLQVCHRI